MTRILGISGLYHDAAAALLVDGKLIAAASEERFTRKKNDPSFPASAAQFCLAEGAMEVGDLDWVVFYEKPFLKLERILMSIMGTFPWSARVFRESMLTWFTDKLWIKSHIEQQLGVDPLKILFSEHHLSHAASALFSSPFDSAAILTVDGVGEWTTTTMGHGTVATHPEQRSELQLGHEIRFPHSLGLLYSVFTALLGFEVNEGEYKVMGMAPFGEPRFVEEVYRLLDVHDDGSFQLDMSYFSYHRHRSRAFTGKLTRLFGEPRNPRARFVTRQTSLYDDPQEPTAEEMDRNQRYADIAASVQVVLEEVLIKMATHLQRETGQRRLCFAGGVALNSVANYRLLRETPFEEIFIHPAAGDAGGAVGAAQYVHHVLLGKPRSFVMQHAYWGKSYSESDTASVFSDCGLQVEKIDDDERRIARVVDALTGGKVVGWCSGRFEWGPRSLGHRSILADPRNARMKDIVNIKIKFREPFRPFAPSVLSERAEELFDFPDAALHYPARFMLMVCPVKSVEVPAITHVDGTARPQTVRQETSPLYHRLIDRFAQATGIPAVLNTSFNLKGEPIVSSPADALHTFRTSGMDLLVYDNHLVTKV